MARKGLTSALGEAGAGTGIRERWPLVVTYERYHRIRAFSRGNAFFFAESEKQKVGVSIRGAGRVKSHVQGVHPVIIGQAVFATVLLPTKGAMG